MFPTRTGRIICRVRIACPVRAFSSIDLPFDSSELIGRRSSMGRRRRWSGIGKFDTTSFFASFSALCSA